MDGTMDAIDKMDCDYDNERDHWDAEVDRDI